MRTEMREICVLCSRFTFTNCHIQDYKTGVQPVLFALHKTKYRIHVNICLFLQNPKYRRKFASTKTILL